MKLKVLLLATGLTLWGHSALAATDVRDCAAIPGSVVGVSGGQCYWLSVSPGGGIPAGTPYAETFLGHQDLTITTATFLTPTATANVADLVADTNNPVPLYCLADSSTPVASSTGIPLSPGGSWHIVGALSGVSCTASSSSILHVQYGK